jgi:hypothetical protein
LLALEQALEALGLGALLAELLLHEEDLEAREAVELQLEDRVGLLLGELEALRSASRASFLPSLLRMILITSSSASKTFSKPSSRWMRLQLGRARTRGAS